MAASLHAFCKWLGETQLSAVIQNVSWIIPTTQSIHILSVAMVISSALMVDLRLLNVVGRSQPTSAYVARFAPWIWWTLIVLALTGSILIIAEPARSLENPSFQKKMVLLILAAAVTLGVQRPLAANQGYWDDPERQKALAKIVAVVSLLLWVGVVFAGRWIAYTNTAGD
jgi:hypothetical protein